MLCKFLLITSFGKTEAYAGLSSCLMSWTRPITGGLREAGQTGLLLVPDAFDVQVSQAIVRATGGFSRARAFDVHAI